MWAITISPIQFHLWGLYGPSVLHLDHMSNPLLLRSHVQLDVVFDGPIKSNQINDGLVIAIRCTRHNDTDHGCAIPTFPYTWPVSSVTFMDIYWNQAVVGLVILLLYHSCIRVLRSIFIPRSVCTKTKPCNSSIYAYVALFHLTYFHALVTLE